jgi:hypothetical protein
LAVPISGSNKVKKNPIERPIKKIIKAILGILRKGFIKIHSKENRKYLEH